MSFFVVATGLFLAALFAQAGWSKLIPANQGYYQEVMRAYSLVPDSLPPALLSLLPPAVALIELSIAGLIVTPMFMNLGLVMASAMIAFYTLLFVAQILAGKADIDCGCAGPGAENKINGLLVARNLALLSFALIAWLNLPGEGVAFQMLSIPMAIMFGLIYLSGDQLIANNQKIQLLRNT